MIERRKGCALTARCHIRAAEVIHHVDAQGGCQLVALTDLDRTPFIGRMKDGLAMEANHIDIRGLEAVFIQKSCHCLRVRRRQFFLCRGNSFRCGVSRLPIRCRLHSLTQVGAFFI